MDIGYTTVPVTLSAVVSCFKIRRERKDVLRTGKDAKGNLRKQALRSYSRIAFKWKIRKKAAERVN
jgi:hypothetical protein